MKKECFSLHVLDTNEFTANFRSEVDMSKIPLDIKISVTTVLDGIGGCGEDGRQNFSKYF